MLLYFIFLDAIRVIVVNCVVVNVLKTNGRVLVQPSYNLWTGDATIDYILTILLEFIENVDWDHQRSKYAKQDKKIVYAQLTPLYLWHYRILLELSIPSSP